MRQSKPVRRNWLILAADCEGFTLIEVLVAVFLFMLIASGVAGTLIISMKGSLHARESAKATLVGQQQWEDMRTRPYYVPYSTDPNVGTTTDTDVLDLYYPNISTSHIQIPHSNGNWEGWYTNNGSDAYYTTISPPDENGMTVKVESRFRDKNMNIVTPTNYDSNQTGSDSPPSNLLQSVITVTWNEFDGSHKTEPLVSEISATGQSTTGGGVGGGGGEDCEHASNSRIDVFGLEVSVFTGADDPYTTVADGNMGEAHVSSGYGCSATAMMTSTAGYIFMNGGTPGYLTGANASLSGPPAAAMNTGLQDNSLSGGYADAAIDSGAAGGYVKSDEDGEEVESKAQATTGTQIINLNDLDVPPEEILANDKQWDFLNPALSANGGSSPQTAHLSQEDGKTTATADVAYSQVNMLPLASFPIGDTRQPPAPEGLVFIRNFQAHAQSIVDGEPGDIQNQFTYSATVGLFNPNKAGCGSQSTGDACYDLYAVSDSNPLQNIPLTDPDYGLESALITEWQSATTTDLQDAMTESSDGTTASIYIDAVMKISIDYGNGVNWLAMSNNVELAPYKLGFERVRLGSIDMAVQQHL